MLVCEHFIGCWVLFLWVIPVQTEHDETRIHIDSGSAERILDSTRNSIYSSSISTME